MIYVCTFLASIFFACLAERSKDKYVIVLCSIISILIPSVLGGLRAYGVGIDTRIYGNPHFLRALSAPDIEYFFEHSRTEPICKLIVYSSKVLGHVNWSYFFYNLITVSCFYIGAYKHRKICSLPLLLFVFYAMWYNFTLNVMRQCLATSIIFMGFDTLENRQYFKFLIYVVFAALCHYSSLIAVILLLIPHYIISSKGSLLGHRFIKNFLLYGTILLVFFLKRIAVFIISFIPFMGKYSHYMLNYAEGHGSRSFLVILIGEIIVFILYYKVVRKNLAKPVKNNFDFFKYNILIIITITTQITIKFITIRLVLCSHFVNLIVLASLPRFVKEKHLKAIVTFSIILVLSFFWWNLYIYKNSSETWPYRSIL